MDTNSEEETTEEEGPQVHDHVPAAAPLIAPPPWETGQRGTQHPQSTPVPFLHGVDQSSLAPQPPHALSQRLPGLPFDQRPIGTQQQVIQGTSYDSVMGEASGIEDPYSLAVPQASTHATEVKSPEVLHMQITDQQDTQKHSPEVESEADLRVQQISTRPTFKGNKYYCFHIIKTMAHLSIF